MKHCNECKHWSPVFHIPASEQKCWNPLLREDNPIGWQHLKCADLREGKCGSDALYFESKFYLWDWVKTKFGAQPKEVAG